MKIAKPEAVKRGARAPRLEDIYVSADVRRATGKALREAVPRTAHAGWKAQKCRSDPFELLSRSNAGRVEALIPIRFGRGAAGTLKPERTPNRSVSEITNTSNGPGATPAEKPSTAPVNRTAIIARTSPRTLPRRPLDDKARSVWSAPEMHP